MIGAAEGRRPSVEGVASIDSCHSRRRNGAPLPLARSRSNI